jgi:Spirocyclase AveC-like
MKMHPKDSTPFRGATKSQPPVLFWSVLGLFWLSFQAFVLGRWITGPYFAAIEPGSDPITPLMETYLFWAQVLCPLALIACLWFWVVLPWRRERSLSSDIMIVIAATTCWFWDFSPSFVVDQVSYNSHMFNRGSWGLHSWPGWVGPGGHRVAEPLFFVPPAYVVLVLSQVMFICWLLRKIKERRPYTSIGTFIAAIVLGLFVIDSIVEMTFLRTGLYAYPAAIHAITLFAGEPYQFPLSEGFLFGGLALGSIGILKFFKDDHGRTYVEKGIEQLQYGENGKKFLRFSAIYGYIHSAFFVLYMLPATLIAVNGDHYPADLPSYLLNGMCLYGEQQNECPGPGVSIPRPENRF